MFFKKRKIKIVILVLCGLDILCVTGLCFAMFLMLPPTSGVYALFDDGVPRGGFLHHGAGIHLTVFFDVPTGSNSRALARMLKRDKLIRSELAFRILARYRGTDRRLHAGIYLLKDNMALWDILNAFEKGDVFFVSWTVPEGLTVSAIAGLWEESGFGTAKAFREAAESPRLLKRSGIPENASVEGYLFPNTYYFAKGATAEKVVEMMLDEFKKQWIEAFDTEANDLGRTQHEIVTLASIIEKEGQSKSEKPRIASVFHNRLKRGWRLQADPTVLYALGNPERLLTKADLRVDSPYNTYVYKGLPPGPIASPGIDSIIAALRPEKTNYLYFVAIGDGKHHFSKTLSEHNRMVRKMRRASRNR